MTNRLSPWVQQLAAQCTSTHYVLGTVPRVFISVDQYNSLMRHLYFSIWQMRNWGTKVVSIFPKVEECRAWKKMHLCSVRSIRSHVVVLDLRCSVKHLEDSEQGLPLRALHRDLSVKTGHSSSCVFLSHLLFLVHWKTLLYNFSKKHNWKISSWGQATIIIFRTTEKGIRAERGRKCPNISVTRKPVQQQ